MQAIPDELSEAARIDGASYWQVQRHIVVPLLGPTIRIWGFLSIIGALQLFDLVYIIWGQYISSTAGTSTMATYMALNGRLAGNYGYGSAVAVVMAIPLALPGVITVAILAFITSWNNYILPLYVLNSQANYTLPLGVQQFSSQYSQDTARVLAFTSLSMLPALAFFAVFQRRIVGGLTGAVKG